MRIYFAGPLFTPAERGFIDECAVQLRAAGYDVFVPHEHELALNDTVTAERIFAKDYEALSTANAVLAILDGPTIDDGTACEIGIFYGLMQDDPSKVGIVGMTHDIRYQRDSAREENRGPLTTTSVPASTTLSPAARAAVTATSRPRGQ